MMTGRHIRVTACLGMLLYMLLFVSWALAQVDGDRPPVRLAFSARLFSDVNEADIRASLKIWITTVAKDLNIPVDPTPHIKSTAVALAEFARTHWVDGFGLITPELVTLSREISFDRFAVGTTGGRYGDEYLLLVHQDSGIERLEQLKGEDINLLDHPRMSLALIWLDTALLKAGLDPASEFFSHVNRNTNASQVVLPVFFRTHKACLVTRVGFEVMAELNPQLKQNLRVLAVSTILIPTGFAFRADMASPFRPQLLKAIEQLHEHPAGHQILTLSQSEAIENHPISIMDDSLALLEEHRRLMGMDEQLRSHDSLAEAEVHPQGEAK